MSLSSGDEDSDWETLGRGFPDLSRLSLKFQWDSFMSDLQGGATFSGALDRLQTLKARWDTMLLNLPSYAERGSSSPHDDGKKGTRDESGTDSKDKASAGIGIANEEIKGPEHTDPTVVTKVHSVMHPTMYTNDLVMPMDKEYTELTHWDVKFNQDEDALRSRIKKIRALVDLSETQKASMIQTLMMKHATVPSEHTGCSHSHESDELVSKGNHVSEYNFDPPEPTEEDKKDIDQIPGVRGCPHYQRNCKLLCSQCNKWVSCRFCHDEEIDDHHFQREATQWILCTSCFHYQAPSSHCDHCGIEFALYYCPICILYDNDETKDIYHCDKCGICRLGLGLGQDFFHCDQCDACLSIELLGNHKCIENSTRSNCPICREYMFTSTMAVVYMDPCGHAIHQHCFDEYIKHSYKCPNCNVSVINMEREFRILHQEIQDYRLPEPYCFWKCKVQCNDCRKKSMVDYHILGLCCQQCGSYNTRQLELIKPEEADIIGSTSSSNDTTPASRTHSRSGSNAHTDRRPTLTSSLSAFQQQNNQELQQLRDELLHSNFQRETVNLNSNWSLDQDRLRQMDDYLRGMVETRRGNPRTGGSAENKQDDDDDDDYDGLGFATRITNFISKQAPDTSALPQLSQAFAQFLGSTHQGLSSSDEDDI